MTFSEVLLAGLTVEINNTDAEGRLILGDGLWYSLRKAIGGDASSSTSPHSQGRVSWPWGRLRRDSLAPMLGSTSCVQLPSVAAGASSHCRCSTSTGIAQAEIADVLNESPGRPAGAITAAMFLRVR